LDAIAGATGGAVTAAAGSAATAATGGAITAQDAAEGADHAAGVEIAAGEITAADRHLNRSERLKCRYGWFEIPYRHCCFSAKTDVSVRRQ